MGKLSKGYEGYAIRIYSFDGDFSPPYYNAREYSHWENLNAYLNDMRLIIKEAYRVLDNHRVFVFNVGDIFDNDNITTTSVWGNRRIPLGMYFTRIFEEEGFTFVDDIIWDKGEVQSYRHKNGSNMNIFLFSINIGTISQDILAQYVIV
ncbi:MAG: hypothetical protein Nk1A_7280 [Endomicrobiia bacterium]|nr:MAG: hypothetical protein Nk1A_7280 [Endomicrobiia bacterium]